MKRKGLFQSVVAVVLAIVMVCSGLPIMPETTKVFADTVPGSEVDLAAKYGTLISSDYSYINNYKSGVDTIVLSSYESQRGDIVLEWPGVSEAGFYDIFRDGNWITSIPADTSMSYDDGAVEGSKTYNYVVFARNNAEEIVGTSNVITAKTKDAMVVSSSLYLDSDKTVFSLDIANGGYLELNGHTLTVCRDITAYNSISVENGKLYCYGNVYVGNENEYGSIGLSDSNGYLYVAGDLECRNGNLSFSDGTVEIGGDLTVDEKAYIYCYVPNTVIFSGFDAQYVSLPKSSSFAEIELRNYSVDGVTFEAPYYYSSIKTNGTSLKIAGEDTGYLNLTEDTTIDGNYELNGGMVFLNGHSLTIKGDFIQNGGVVDLDSGILNVNGDYIQTSGKLNVNGGTVNIGHDYRMQSRTGTAGNYTYGQSDAYLYMTSTEDTVNVAGSFYCASYCMSSSDRLNAGRLCIGGDVELLTSKGSNYFETYNNHTLVLNGTGRQTVKADYLTSYPHVRFANIVIENPTDGNVVFNAGDNIEVKYSFNDNGHAFGGRIQPGSYNTVFANNVINGSLVMDDYYIYFYNAFEIKGNLYLRNSCYIYNDLTVDGNVYIGEQYIYNSYSGDDILEYTSYDSGYLCIYGPKYSSSYKGKLDVKGSILCDSSYNQSFYNYGGTVSVGGDFLLNDNTYYTESYLEDCKIIFCGTQKQTLHVPDNMNLGNVIIQNTSSEGVVATSNFRYESIEKNGNNLTYFSDAGRIGWTLSADEAIEGDLILVSGTLDLNGHKLTVSGDFIQPGGTVFINGGELNVGGDYRIQSVSGDTYGKSAGLLVMTNENDKIYIGGGFYTSSSQYASNEKMNAGVMDVKGDFIVDCNYNSNVFCPSGSHKVVFSGDSSQNVKFLNSNYNYSYLNNVEITNPVDGNVSFGTEERSVVFKGEFDDGGHSIGGYIQPSGNASLKNGTLNGSINITNNNSIYGTYHITGDLIIKNNMSLYGTMTVDGDIIFNSSKIFLYGNDEAESYLEVKGDIKASENCTACYIDFNRGSLKLYGDLNIPCCKVTTSVLNATTYDTNKFILCGTKKQTIEVASGSSFGQIIIENTSEDGVCSRNKLDAISVKDDNNKLKYGTYGGNPATEGVYGWTLQEDQIITEDLVLYDRTLDLNGHTLTVNGDLIQAGGLIVINKGTLIVKGDYRIQTRTTASNGDYAYGSSTGSLKMTNAEDTVEICGSFYNQATKSGAGLLTAGEMYIGKDFYLYSYEAFAPSGTHTVYFNVSKYQNNTNNSKKHYIYSNYNFAFNDLVFEAGNTITLSSSYVGASGNVNDNGTTISGTLSIYPETTFTNDIYHGSVNIYGAGDYKKSFEITGDMTVSSDANFYGNLTVDGSVTVNRYSELYLKGEESEFTVKKNLCMRDNTELHIENKTTNLYGNSSIYTYRSYYYTYIYFYFNGGTVNLYGDMSISDSYDRFNCKEGTVFNFCGNTKQTVTVYDNYKFSDIVINNTSNDGVLFTKSVVYDSLVTNGYKVRFGNSTLETGWTLTEDAETEGDYYLGEGELNLAGHNLTIKGNLYQTGGTVKLNGGTLTVLGDYNITGLSGSGYPSGKSSGTLVMNNNSDHLLVKGSVKIIQNTTSTEQGPNTLTAGVFEMMGNCYVDYDTLKGTDQFKVVFSGSTQRTISGTIRAPYFENRCTADESGNIGDILMNGSLHISKKATDLGQNIKGSGYLYTSDLAVIDGNSYSGNIYLNQTSTYNESNYTTTYSECTLTKDLTIGGSLNVYSKLSLDKYTLRAAKIYVNKLLDVQKGKIVCDGNLVMDSSEGILEMTDDEAYILVKGNFSTYTSSNTNRPLTVNFTAGTFELQGNFTDEYTPSSFNSSGTNTVILSGKTVNGSDFIQKIKISDTSVKFNKMILKKPDTAYKFSRKIKNMAKEVIRDVNTSGVPSNISDITVVSYTESSVKLSYSEATDDQGVAGYRIYRNGAVCGATTALTFTDTGLKPNTTYTYKVFAIDADNNLSEDSPSVTVTTKTDNSRPDPVKTMSVSKRTGSSVTLTWKAAIDNVGIKYYELYRKDGSGDYNLISGNIKKTTYKDTGLTAGVSYKYYLVAIDTSGNRSDNGVVIDASVVLPQIISVSPTDKSRIGGNYIDFKVTYNNWGKSQNNTVMIEYEDRNNEWKPVTSYALGQNADQYYTNRLYSSYKWYFGDADFNDSVRFKITLTDEDGNTDEKIVTYIIDRTAPAVPENFKAADNGGTVKLTWSPTASDDCTGYKIYRSTTAGQNYSQIGTVTGRNNLSYTDTSVKKNVKYYYAIEAYDDSSNISEKAESGEIAVEDDTQPPKVTSIGPDKSVIGNGSVTIMVKAEDNKAVNSVILSIQKVNDSNWSTLTEVLCNEGTALYNLNTASYEDGDYYICAKARDEEGNVSKEFTRKFTFDNTGISKTTLTGHTISSSVIELVWGQELSESDFAYYSVEQLVRVDNGIPVYTRIAKVTNNYNCYISDLVPGEEHTYIVVGYDIYGNRGIESDPVTLSTFVDTTGPTITLVSNAGLPYAEIIPLSVKAKDDRALKKAVFKYSYDGINYEEITSVEVSSTDAKEDTFIYNWNVKNLREGKVYVLYEVYDTAGNKNLLTKDDKDVIAEFIIDRTAPGKVTGLELVKRSGSVEFKWDNPETDAAEDKVVGFVVVRIDGQTGKTTTLKKNYTALNYIDQTVSVGSTYIYKVAAIDKAGNQGEYSDELKVKVVDDEIAPEIKWIDSDEREVLPINPEIRVYATDNSSLAKLYVEYAFADTDTETWIPLYDGTISGTEEVKEIKWNTDGLTEGRYTVRAYATDAVENESEYVSKEFTLDLTAPEKPVLNVTNGNMYIDLEIEGTVPDDFSRYEIYRREAGNTDFIDFIYRGKEKTFRDDEVEALSVYVYQAVIYDIHGNAVKSDEVEGVAKNIDTTAPEAKLMSDIITGVVGDEITLYGGNSWDNVGITAYKWYIDDTYIGDGIRRTYKFTEAKDYKLKLEVYDRAGNVGTAEGTVVISEKDETGTFTIIVKSDQGEPLGNAIVNILEPNGYSSNVSLDNTASISFSKAPGTYKVGAYVNGYLPKEITVNVNAQEKKEYVISLTKDKLLEAKVTVNKLSLAELEMKGVDLSNPANYNTVEVEFDVMIEGQIVHYRTVTSPKNPGRIGVGGGGSGSGSGSSKGEFIVTLVRDVEPVIVYYESRPAVSWLNDMYEVKVSVLNKASSEFSIEDLTATLQLPQYVSLAALTGKAQTTTQNKAKLNGGDSWSASWIVKGSRSGTYNFNVDINGTVMPFETLYSITATGEAKIEVTSGKGLHLFIVVNRFAAIHDDNDFVNYVLVNEGEKEFKNVSISLGDEAIEYNGEDKDVEVDSNKVTVGTLASWESLSLRAPMTGRLGRALKESNLDYHIEYLRGKNLGVEITVVDSLPDLYHKADVVDEDYGHLKWEVKYGVLTVEGTGNYADPAWSSSQVVAPWHDGETEKHIGMAVIDVKDMTLTTAMFEDCIKLTSFSFKNGTDNVTNMSRMFKNCRYLSSVPMKQLRSYKVKDLSYMFMGCTSLYSLDGSGFYTYSVTDITGMFENCKNLKELDLKDWNFIEVEAVENVFLNCDRLEEVLAPLHSKSRVYLPEASKDEAWYREDAGKNILVYAIDKSDTSKRYFRTIKEVDTRPIITVQFYGEDTSSCLPIGFNLRSGEELILPEAPYSKSGFVFNGWYDQKDGKGKKYENGVITASYDTILSLYAYFDKKEAVIFYDANGGTGAPDPSYKVGNDTVYISTIEPTRQGYLFTGWDERPSKTEYTGSNYYPGQVVKTSDYGKTLYAHWVNENDYYRVDLYNCDRPDGMTKLCMVKKDSWDYVTLPFSYENEPEQIEGWYSTPSFGVPRYEPAFAYKPTSNSKLYAQWVSYDLEYVTIKFNLNYPGCPENTIPDGKMYENNDFEIPDYWPEREGYVFIGWTNDPDETYGVFPGEKVRPDFEDQTYYAMWTEYNSLALQNQLKKEYGDKYFPDRIFWKEQTTWIEVNETNKKAVICVCTEPVYYGDEHVRIDYRSHAAAFILDGKSTIWVKEYKLYDGGGELNIVDRFYSFVRVQASKLPGDSGKTILFLMSTGKLIGELYVDSSFPMVSKIVGGVDTGLNIYETAVYFENYFMEHDFEDPTVVDAFMAKYEGDFEKDTLLGLIRIAQDFVGHGGSYYLDSKMPQLSIWVSYLLEILELIANDNRFNGLDIPGESDYAVGSMMDLMTDAGFDKKTVSETPQRIGRLIDGFPVVTQTGSNCPVDIKVYDSTGALVGYIKDNVPQVIEGGITTEVDENEQKLAYLDGSEEYKLEIIATDDGEVTFFTQTFNTFTEDVSNVRTYSDMKVKKGDVIKVDVSPIVVYETPAEDGCKAETPVKLVINDGEEVEPTAVQKGTQIVSYNVTAGSSNAEAGTVTGGGSFYNGEFCKVTATAKDGYEFKGWMEDGKLVSSDAEYRFEVNADHNVVAEFAKKDSTEGGSAGGSTGGSTGGYSGGGSSGGYSGGGSSGGYSGGGSSGGYSGGGSSGGYSGGGSSGGVSGGGTGGTTGGTSGGSTGGTTGTGNTGNGGSGKTDGKDGDTSKEFEVKVGAVYTDENGIRYEITAIKGTKKATSNAVKYIGPDKSGVKKIVIPNSVIIEGNVYIVSELGTEWTKGNKKLTTVVINDNIKKIPTDAFKGCKALKKVTFGKNVTTIGTRSFYGCTKLKTVKLPANLTKIGNKAFYGCTAIQSITIPSKVESISSYAFYRCTKLYKVTIKSKHLTEKKIGKKVFAGIVTNAVIKVPKSVIDKYTDLLKKAGVTKDMTVTK